MVVVVRVGIRHRPTIKVRPMGARSSSHQKEATHAVAIDRLDGGWLGLLEEKGGGLSCSFDGVEGDQRLKGGRAGGKGGQGAARYPWPHVSAGIKSLALAANCHCLALPALTSSAQACHWPGCQAAGSRQTESTDHRGLLSTQTLRVVLRAALPPPSMLPCYRVHPPSAPASTATAGTATATRTCHGPRC